MPESKGLGHEVREAVGWLTFALIANFLPHRLRDWLSFSGPLAVALSLWLASVFLVVIPVRPAKSRKRKFLFIVTIVCVLMYVGGRLFDFPK